MSTKSPPTRQEVLDAVRSWPADDQFDLAFEILRTLEPDSPSPDRRREALRELRGIAKTANPPTDEDVRRWLDEHRMAKYG
jgi:hypothetical protein